jgi:hypothetical protein
MLARTLAAISANNEPTGSVCDSGWKKLPINGYKNDNSNISARDIIANLNGSFNNHVVSVVCFILIFEKFWNNAF